jgi:hypothetical protein
MPSMIPRGDKQFLETVARVAPSVRARRATERVTSNGALHEAQQPHMQSPSRAPSNAAHAFGPDLSGAQHPLRGNTCLHV